MYQTLSVKLCQVVTLQQERPEAAARAAIVQEYGERG